MKLADSVRGDVVTVKRSRKSQWNSRCQVEKKRLSGSDAFTVLDVVTPFSVKREPFEQRQVACSGRRRREPRHRQR